MRGKRGFSPLVILAIIIASGIVFAIVSLLGLRYVKELMLDIGIEYVLGAIIVGVILYFHKFILAVLEWLLGVFKSVI